MDYRRWPFSNSTIHFNLLFRMSWLIELWMLTAFAALCGVWESWRTQQSKGRQPSQFKSFNPIKQPNNFSCLMDEWIELEWNCFLSLPWAGWAKPSIEFHSMNGRNGLWLRSPASQGRGRESMEWKNWFVSEVNVVEWKQRRKWNLMKSNGMNFCCAMERSEWNAAPSSPQLRGKPSQSTNQSLFMKANWWLLARSLLLPSSLFLSLINTTIHQLRPAARQQLIGFVDFTQLFSAL